MQHLSNKQLQQLADKWLKGELTFDEQKILDDWYNQPANDQVHWPGNIKEDKLKQKLFNHIEDGEKPKRGLSKYPALGAIAATLLLFAGAALLYNKFDNAEVKLRAKTNCVKHDYTANNTHEVLLTLADGSTMVLNNPDKNGFFKHGNTLVQDDGKVAYIHGSAAVMNNVSTPAGETFKIKLPDGTMVWLNALSSLKFPTAFTGKERKVELTGEAYFEVTKDKNKPFVVNANKGTTVKVLGTHFNVMAYAEETNVNTTLLEGLVMVKKSGVEQIIKPGQQAAVGKAIAVTNVDTQQAIAWKDDQFSFDGAGTKEIMRQLGRWYGVKVIYGKTGKNHQLTGYVSRKSSLTDVLKMLELSGMNFSYENNTIEVLH